MPVQFASFTRQEMNVVNAIAQRAVNLATHPDKLSAHMDISAVHATCPLRLNDLLNSERFDFIHDMGGIRRHLNRDTGELENFFLPRFARQ